MKRLFALPVLDRGRHVIGIITLTDVFRHARADSFQDMGGGLRRLLRRTPEVTSGKPEVADQIVRTPAITEHEESLINQLVPVLTERRLHRIPIVDARNKLGGLVTQADLNAAMSASIPGRQDS